MKQRTALGRIRKAVQARQPKLRVAKDMDILIYLNCIEFLRQLASESAIEAQTDRVKVIQDDHVQRAAVRVLSKFKGKA